MAERPHESRVQLKIKGLPIAAQVEVLKDIVEDCERKLEKAPKNAEACADKQEAKMLLKLRMGK